MSQTPARGTMIVVVGPSGAGKDTLIDYARDRLSHNSDISFVRRVITRPATAGGEDHLAVTEAEFELMRQQQAFAVSWGAHGLFYGIPTDTLGQIARGSTLVANGSRAALGEFRQAYARLAVIAISARQEIIAERLAARGRESLADIQARLARSADGWQAGPDCISIDNSGTVEEAGQALCDAVEALARR